ncbi:DUF2164 domain-containing protein [Cytobacillus spongiae]|uniref:DUF2164 domain-containing protein n=1 Tax=Cytobacillus spongiae TaxID=2901381 RepID=UPI001F42C497|nr:DUF2164 domain-containing protein [Cytobacillus spongiae]UII54461.1 DUF2164 domain-containing protein [Cytobacillus spongiae]
MSATFELSKEQKEQMTEAIKEFFWNSRDEEIGDLAAILVLDFFMSELAPLFYNKGVADSHQFISEKLEDLFEIQK